MTQTEQYQVQKIIQRGNFDNVTQYLVLWKNYPLQQATWEPITNLEHCRDAIVEFQTRIKQGDQQSNGRKKKRQKKMNFDRIYEKQRCKNDRTVKDDYKLTSNQTDNGSRVTSNEQFKFERPKTRQQFLQQSVPKRQYFFNNELNPANSYENQKEQAPKEKLINNIGKRSIHQLNRYKINLNSQDQEEIVPVKRFKTNSEIELASNNQPKSSKLQEKIKNIFNQSASIQKKIPEKQKMNEPIRSSIREQDLAKLTKQDNQISMIKQLFNTLKQTEQQPKQKQKTNEKQKVAQPLQNQILLKQQPIIDKAKPVEEIKMSITFSKPKQTLKQGLIINSNRYLRCDQQHEVQKRKILRNVMHKELNQEPERYKVRTIDVSDESILQQELKNITRVRDITAIEKLQLLVRVPFGWIAVGRTRERGLFLVDVNLIEESHWEAIKQKYMASQ